MQTSMKLLLTAPPDQCRAALRFGLPVAHVAYRVGGGPHLFRASIPVSVRGGLMVIDNTGFDGRGEAGPFCQEVLRECMARGYDGILCDFEGHPLQVLAQAVRTLGELTKKRGWPLYVTEAYAPFSDFAIALIPSALSGGSLQQRLQEAVERFGAARVALAVELLEGEQLRGTRLYTVPPHHEDGPADVRIEGIRFYLPGGAGPEGLTLRADAHYIDRGDRCVLP